MSLTTHLLLNKPITLPIGRAYFHSMEKKRSWEMSEKQKSHVEKMTAIRLQNIERIYKAVCAGISTKLAVCEITGLSESTVLHALQYMGDTGRISVLKEGRKHTYHALKAAA